VRKLRGKHTARGKYGGREEAGEGTKTFLALTFKLKKKKEKRTARGGQRKDENFSHKGKARRDSWNPAWVKAAAFDH